MLALVYIAFNWFIIHSWYNVKQCGGGSCLQQLSVQLRAWRRNRRPAHGLIAWGRRFLHGSPCHVNGDPRPAVPRGSLHLRWIFKLSSPRNFNQPYEDACSAVWRSDSRCVSGQMDSTSATYLTSASQPIPWLVLSEVHIVQQLCLFAHS